MPMYSCICLDEDCLDGHDYFSKYEDREATPPCKVCSGPTLKQITASMVGAMTFTDHKRFQMPDGTWINSGSDYKRYLKDNNVMPADEAHVEAARAKEYKAADRKKEIRKAVVEAYKKHKTKTKELHHGRRQEPD